jgi:hypothetical protein
VDLELKVEEEGEEGGEDGGGGGIEEDSLLLHFFHLKIHPDSVFSVRSNPHTKPSSSLTQQRKFFETLSHHEKVPLSMPSPRFEKFCFSIQSMDSLQQAHLNHDVSFPW